ncbi:uncharacterized protein LOC114307440 [Camellia sinensis]|uniref:uncharacterized protein LOC114307440 n=1 Tax=Camellia sinensis TaxID=4442 RepID=UPI0010360A75|nr:uncharacterized protein LOC114307440 [Camellia sinensis]
MIYDLLTPLTVHAIQALQKQRTPSKQPHEAPSIIFNDFDLIGVTLPYSDPLVIELHVNRFVVECVFIDQGSTFEVMYYETFVKLGFNQSDLSPAPHPLFSFNANPEYPLGKITPPVQANSRTMDVVFLVIKLPLPYNIIMGRTWLHAIQAVPSTYHQLLRFPTQHGIERIRGSRHFAPVFCPHHEILN